MFRVSKLPPSLRNGFHLASRGVQTGFPIAFALVFGGAVGISCFSLVWNSYVRIQTISGPSMAPTLSPHYHERGSKDKVLIDSRSSEIPHLERGDIVVFTKPHDPESEGVKRIIGLPGDTILRDVRKIGKREKKEYNGTKELGMAKLGPVVVVPQGSVWVEGDNWRESWDSNDFGPVR